MGVPVWLPEAGGPVELDSPVHQALMVLLGAQARCEVVRARHRVMAAMREQTRSQGRFLGGRPPYGYRLADGGPHPNAMQARWGRWVQVLEPDPVTAPWVRWLFAERARGRSVASLARELNERGVPCPSSADRARNLHRTGSRWITRTVGTILENPRYTGRQVWNRQSSKGHGASGRTGGRSSEWCAGARWGSGRCPSSWRMHRWLTRTRLSRCSGAALRGAPRTAIGVPTCWPGWSSVGCAAVGWMCTGLTVAPATAAVTATPPARPDSATCPGTSTSAKTTCSRPYLACSNRMGGCRPGHPVAPADTCASMGWRSCVPKETPACGEHRHDE